MQIEQVPISTPQPYLLNNRKRTKLQIQHIADSITQFGFNQPIVIDENNEILVGHGRLEAAKLLKLSNVPVLKKTGLTEAQKKAYRILDNKLQNDSEWDIENLELELNALEELGFELEPWGLDELRFNDEEELETEEDNFEPNTPTESFIKLGDLIELGSHRLLCGDATEDQAFKDLLAGQQANLVVTDPPYNVAYEGKTKEALTIQNDSMNDDQFLIFLTKSFQNFSGVLTPGGSYYIFHADLEGLNFRLAVKNAELLLKQTIIWNKNSMVMGRQDYQWKHEPCLYGWKPGASHYFVDNRTLTTVWDLKRPSRSTEHPTMKPLELMAECIKNSSKKNQIVLDPFLGSGSTLIAADQLDRVCYGLELEPKYCQVIIQRYKKHCESKNKPFICKINGEPFNGKI